MRSTRTKLCAIAAIMLGIAAISISPVYANVIISEVYYDPDGADSGKEFIELYNNGTQPVDLSSWQIQWAGPTFDYRTLHLEGTIQPAGFFLIGGETVKADFGVNPDILFDLNFQNGGSASDGIRIYDGDHYYDTVIYDEPNTNGLPGDDSWSSNNFAPDVTSGHSLIRSTLTIDTDEMTDFIETPTPSPQNSSQQQKPTASLAEPSGLASLSGGLLGFLVKYRSTLS